MPYTNLHTKFQKNPSMFVESRANTNVHRFHAQVTYGMLYEYEINRTYSVDTMVIKRQMRKFYTEK